MTVTLSSDALTTLGTIKDELGLSVATYDETLKRLINAVSRRIRSYCDRTFYYEGDISEDIAGHGATNLVVSRRPIVSISSITYNDSTVDSDSYSISNAEAGIIYRASGWPWTAQNMISVVGDQLPGTEQKHITVTYSAGWVTPEQSGSGSITAFADGGSGAVTVTSAAHGLANGDRVTITGTTNYNGTFAVSGVTTNTFDITDTWVSDDATGTWTNARTLPGDLEDACILAVVSRYRNKGQDQRISSEKSLDYSVTYASGGDILPPPVKEMLAPYRELF